MTRLEALATFAAGIVSALFAALLLELRSSPSAADVAATVASAMAMLAWVWAAMAAAAAALSRRESDLTPEGTQFNAVNRVSLKIAVAGIGTIVTLGLVAWRNIHHAAGCP